MSLYLSTGRKPSATTRKLARLLSLLLHAEYENRGKRSVDEICARAEKFGCEKIAFIYEQKGNPTSFEFYDQEKGWLNRLVSIKSIVISPEKHRRIPSTIKITFDRPYEFLTSFFGLKMSESQHQSDLEAKFTPEVISFELDKKPILTIKIKLIDKQKPPSSDRHL